MKEDILKRLKDCEICEVNNKKTRIGHDFVATARIREKFGNNIMKEEIEDKTILVGIDYF